MPPKRSKAFASHFASSDEEEEQATNVSSKAPAPKAKPGRKPKKNASAQQEVQNVPAPIAATDVVDDQVAIAVDEDDDDDGGDAKNSSENPKPTSSRRGRGGRGGRGGMSARGDRAGSKAKSSNTTTKKDQATAKRAGRSRSAKTASADNIETEEEEQGKSVSDAQMVDDSGEGDENGEVEDIDMTVEETLEEIPPPQPKRTAVSKSTKSNKSRTADKANASHSDDELRVKQRERKPAEMEELTRKYNELLKLRTTEAEAALSSFKENMKQKDLASKKLIDTLRSEANAATALSSKSKELQDEIKKITAQLQEKDKQLLAQQRAFESLQRENEQLAVKLKSSGRPGGGGTAVTGGSVGGAGGGKTTFRDISSMKEELYGDLSGLIIRTVQDDNEGQIVYDCLQTGRNGTLHFKLSVSSSALSNRSDGYNCADSEITYTPLLDLRRDKLLDEILPDYLKEEITFPREKSSGFYLRLANSLQNAQVSR